MSEEFPVGRTVTSMEHEKKNGTDEELTLTFDDGSLLIVRSWDYEGYKSGLYVEAALVKETA